MNDHYDALETRQSAEREADLFSRLPEVLCKAMEAPAYAQRLKGTDPASIASRAARATVRAPADGRRPLSLRPCQERDRED